MTEERLGEWSEFLRSRRIAVDSSDSILLGQKMRDFLHLLSEEAAFRDSFHRFLDLFENDPKPSFKLLTVFSDFYEDYESEPEYAAEHLNTLCDTYQGMSPDEKNNFDHEVLVQLTAPCTT